MQLEANNNSNNIVLAIFLFSIQSLEIAKKLENLDFLSL